VIALLNRWELIPYLPIKQPSPSFRSATPNLLKKESYCSLELLVFSLQLELFMENQSQNINVDIIYNYTESHVKCLEESITRIDGRFSTFIGFSAVLIRLALDLPDESYIMKILVCVCSVLTIIISAVGLGAKQIGNVLHPSALMSDQYFYESDSYKQCLIINDQINLINEYESVIQKKGKRLNWMIGFFTIAIIFYGIGVSGLDTIVLKLITLHSSLNYLT
jgi:hypothetical protein